MSRFWFFFLILHALLLLFLPVPSFSQKNGTVSCPLNFTVIQQLASNAGRPNFDVPTTCRYVIQSLRLVKSVYLRTTNNFAPPLNSSESCWSAFQLLLNDYVRNFDIRSSCGFQTSWISEGCMNINNRTEFERVVPKSMIDTVVQNCNQSLANGSPCASCTTSLSNLQASYLTGPSVGNVSDCTALPSIYAGAFANYLGPTDLGTAECLYSLRFTSKSSSKNKKTVIVVVVICCVSVLLLVIGGFWWWKKRQHSEMRKRRLGSREVEFGSALESISGSTNLVKFSFDEIRKATRNFSRDYIIGRGGYGNVYKGVLADGSEVALKRFKNCSAAGDASFAHEVEVIASVRHVNLVALRGYCIATTPMEGHQRIIVCDLMKNGSLHDHVFGYQEKKLMRDGRALDVIEDDMPDKGPPQVLEKYVLVAVLCSHPQLYARPTMDQAVKMLETDMSLPSIPERPIPLVAELSDIERSVSTSGSGTLVSPRGYSSYTYESDRPLELKEESQTSGSRVEELSQSEGASSGSNIGSRGMDFASLIVQIKIDAL
ncbi:hypothetical protein FEM48_Zijuj09G0033000 [Ziziphus jujuba var. spinosa]|uniref:Protein kinase domain-containing protein n=1 Tax=Ziziphus jujuba var. spinosa TaxID=714518 RepID=A0A978UQL1_ZIZJJ|nr:hypothetical protein FEM48_Zijuj09G0033000 [Ziziphus jujuba var. spinosa]